MSISEMIKIQIKLFATLGRFLPDRLQGTPYDLEMPDGSNLNDVLNRMQIPLDETKVVFVNNRVQELDYILIDGDRVGIFPPVGGG